MREHSIDVEWDPTVHWSSATAEDMDIVKRRTWLLTFHILEWKFSSCHPVHI